MKKFFSLQLDYSIHQQRLELMIQKYGPQHPKTLLQSQKVNNLFIQMKSIILNQIIPLQDNAPAP